MTANGLIRIGGEEGEGDFGFGGKGLRLRQLAKAGIEVPDGLLLSREYLSVRMDEYVSPDEIRKLIASEESGEKGLEKRAMELFEKAGAYGKLSDEIGEHLANMEGYASGSLFAVRSAALGEDDVEASHAGQFETILNVPPDDIGREIFGCMASWWSDRATAYRKSKGMPADIPRMSIIVQRMVSADFAGVMFTRHPFDGDKDAMLVEAVSGLGEKLVSGKVTPSSWELDRLTGAVLAKRGAGEKHGAKLRESHLQMLFSAAGKIGKELGPDQDIEWAIENDRLFVLQARPITTRPGKGKNRASEKTVPAPFDLENTYSRAVVEDLWADRMSDVTSSIVFDEFSDMFTFKGPMKRLGMKELAKVDSVKVIGGYGYMSCRAAAMALEYVPGFLRSREIGKMFPGSVRREFLKTPVRPNKLLAAALHAPRLFEDPVQLPFLTDILLRKFLGSVERALNGVPAESYLRMDLAGLGRELERLLRIQGRLQSKNQWGYGKATIYTWLLRQFASKSGDKDDAWVLEKITRIPDNVTLRSQRDLEKIASLCDEKIREAAFEKSDDREILETLNSRFADHPAVLALHAFIEKYRFRSANRDFIHPRWDETPEAVAGMVARRLELSDGIEGDSFRRSKDERMKKIAERKKTSADLLLEPLVRGARKFLALREELRWGLDKIFYRIRRVLLETGRRPEFSSCRDMPDAVFFLELKELRRIYSGECSPDLFFEKVERRRTAYLEEKDVSPSYYVAIDPTTKKPVPVRENESSELLEGVAASPGIARGVARSIRGPEEFHLFRKGDVLVAGNTDPGWTPLFASASAVVTEMGGILNHCAIVAREYGVPAVVGVEGVTGKIKTGMPVEVDGSAGTVRLLG